MQWHNKLTSLLHIRYPVIQAPMLGVTTPEMVAAISNAGGLGSLPVGGLSPQKTIELISKTRSLTRNPFAVNLFAHENPANVDSPELQAMEQFLRNLCLNNGLAYEKAPVTLFSYRDQVQILIDEKIPVVSFTFGIPDENSLAIMKQKGITLIGTATCVEEAIIANHLRLDAICLQGMEAGGHRGSFKNPDHPPLVGLMSLVPETAQLTSLPLIAAGGIKDGPTIRASFLLGASGVQIGSAFIASDESAAIRSYKKLLSTSLNIDTILTRSLSGRWARGIKNKMITAIESSGLKIPAYPLQQALTAPVRLAAIQKNDHDFTALWAGQSAAGARLVSAADIFRSLIAQTEAII